ncbi:hypothetical protein EG359_04480 [Chryseobacterium joostei]|uniref:DUF1700 domain-containing protein n=1 Tax=Chryseobacterium joostei TaxID=112234 RepID=A0A1N7HW43_9FLAO|nr:MULTISPECIES: hypothetical protein [Chryseobacterium]AZA98907.1 hypothetical protein EG359_04480 [Chryseobacterium joostei]SIS29036.1 hypothetical protein SAMN05421768_101464 [Chryseobacterium joostei]
MNEDLKREIFNKYKKFLAENYSEKYIYRLIIQEGYNQEDVDEVMKGIHADKQEILKEKNKYRTIVSILLYIAGFIVIIAGLILMVSGGIKIGMALIFFAVIIWINANR